MWTYIQETYRTLLRQDQRRTSPRHVIIKMTNIEAKERILKAVRTKERVTYRGKTIKITPDFSTQVRNARRDWYEVLWTLEENNFQPRLICPAKLSFKIDGEIKMFHDKQTQRIHEDQANTRENLKRNKSQRRKNKQFSEPQEK